MSGSNAGPIWLLSYEDLSISSVLATSFTRFTCITGHGPSDKAVEIIGRFRHFLPVGHDVWSGHTLFSLLLGCDTV